MNIRLVNQKKISIDNIWGEIHFSIIKQGFQAHSNNDLNKYGTWSIENTKYIATIHIHTIFVCHRHVL